MAGPSDDDADKTVVDALLDALVYAPIGLTLDARDVTPDLAKRGRQHAAAARQIGELAVKAGLRRLEDALGSDEDTAPRRPAAKADPVASPVDEAPVDEAPVDEAPATSGEALALPIPDYDTLAASQVVKRLDALTEDELEAVRLHETGTRDRRTILHKIARLQS